MNQLSEKSDRSGAVFRFAPSPNGYLHRGHALSALLNARAAEATGGRFLLRIEDIDRDRSRPEFELAILQDLAWLGLSWETPVLRQSERFDAYRAALSELGRLGLLYPSFLSRAAIAAVVGEKRASEVAWPSDPEGAAIYPGVERDWSEAKRKVEIASGRPYALRLDMARALAGAPALAWREREPFGAAGASMPAAPSAWGDVVLARKETPASYHLAVVVDDAFQNVSHIIRGVDLQPATSVHRLLQHLLRLPKPAYWHHPLLLDESGAKLSKSRGSESIRARRAAGESPADLIAGLDLPPITAG